jgi:hypothetical protein
MNLGALADPNAFRPNPGPGTCHPTVHAEYALAPHDFWKLNRGQGDWLNVLRQSASGCEGSKVVPALYGFRLVEARQEDFLMMMGWLHLKFSGAAAFLNTAGPHTMR